MNEEVVNGQIMDTSPTSSLGGSRARAALLATTGSGTGSTDRRVVFLASSPGATSSHETKTWPHNWSPNTDHIADKVNDALLQTLETSRKTPQAHHIFKLNLNSLDLALKPTELEQTYTEVSRELISLKRQVSDGSETKCWKVRAFKKTGNNYKSPASSPHAEYKLRMSRGQQNWSDEAGNSNSISRQSRPTRQTQPSSSRTCTPQHDEQHHLPSCNGFRFGVYGWRKRCLYSLVLGLMIMVILNLALTLWLLKVMEFSSEGIGSLKVVPGGIELRGQAAILDALIASSVRSRRGKNLVFESWSNFTASARAHDGRLLARFTLGEDRVDFVSKGFRITDPRGGVLFSADREQVVVGATMLKVTGVGGAVFRGSVQTPLVRAESGHGLRLESATRSLEIKAPERVVIESRAGEISASCLSDLTLQSIEGAVRLDAKSVFLKGLKIGTSVQRHTIREQQQQLQQQQQQQQKQLPLRNGRSPSEKRESNVYQLCVCANGKLFLARPEGVCQADKTIC